MRTPSRERSGAPPCGARRAGARVLVVDDSPYTRQTLKAMAEDVPGVGSVDLAGNGRIALAKALRRPPDLVILDLAMPVMDGFTFLRIFRGHSDAPVLVVSSHADLGNLEKALELGASGFVSKPEDPYRNLSVIAEELTLKISRWVGETPAGGASAPRVVAAAKTSSFPVIAIGSSSGGPSTVQYLLSSLPAEMGAAVLIAQHMPPGFTESFAKRLGSLLPIAVREARHGEPVRAGEVLVSPGGHHMRVRRGDEGVQVELEPGGDALWVPSVDRLFQSCAEVFGHLLTAVVLTGMGRDGADGVRDVKARGGRTLAESEETAAIYGMPREAAATGCVDEVLALPEIAVRLIRTAAAPRPGRPSPRSADDPSPGD
ncbi:MAG: response regulator [Deltaproteobacteria bacterium]|nr:response regulator [Deltaproteobacteria bacterium]